jgi:aspartate/methionine/tyrosine aminotransferase
MIYLNIGEPDFTAPPRVPCGAALPARRPHPVHPGHRVAGAARGHRRWYGTRFGLEVDPARIVVTAGASAALQLA